MPCTARGWASRLHDFLSTQAITQLITSLLAVAISLSVSSATGRVVTRQVESERLAGNLIGETTSKELLIYLPDGYDSSQEAYPVVYWFPGAGHRSTVGIDFKQLGDEFTSGRSVPSIIVFMPSRTNFGSSTYLSSEAFGDWEGFLTTEVIPLIDSTYRTQPTPAKRGVMGFSLGGFTSLMLPVLAPGTFGAVGANDPGFSIIPGSVRDVADFPDGVVLNNSGSSGTFVNDFPTTLDGYRSTSLVHSFYGQVAARLSPNPESPVFGDLPFDRNGQWVPHAREAWSEFDLLSPEVVQEHLAALSGLATVSVTLPSDSPRVTPWNRELIRVYQEAGLPAQGIEVEGEHNELWHERFVKLLSNVSHALNGTTVHPMDEKYAQSFDLALGTNTVGGELLPEGWSVSDGYRHVFRDRTNVNSTVTELHHHAQEPHILNAGVADQEDRALAIYLPQDSQGATIQFLADVGDVAESNALRLAFDIEAWDFLGQSSPETLGEAAFRITAELDRGDGFGEPIDLGMATTGLRLPQQDGAVVNGNDDEFRMSFDTSVVLPAINEADSLRLRWTADGQGSSGGWVFGLDDVTVELLLRGDFDNDRRLSPDDIDLLTARTRDGTDSATYDLNADGQVDQLDRDYWVNELVASQFGDANLDRRVDFADFLLVQANFAGSGGWGDGDFDGNGTVDFADFLAVANNLSTGGVAAVPEPQIGLLWLLICLTPLLSRLRK